MMDLKAVSEWKGGEEQLPRGLALGQNYMAQENTSESETAAYLTILSENAWSAGKVPEQLVKKMSCSTAGRNETLGIARPQI